MVFSELDLNGDCKYEWQRLDLQRQLEDIITRHYEEHKTLPDWFTTNEDPKKFMRDETLLEDVVHDFCVDMPLTKKIKETFGENSVIITSSGF